MKKEGEDTDIDLSQDPEDQEDQDRDQGQGPRATDPDTPQQDKETCQDHLPIQNCPLGQDSHRGLKLTSKKMKSLTRTLLTKLPRRPPRLWNKIGQRQISKILQAPVAGMGLMTIWSLMARWYSNQGECQATPVHLVSELNQFKGTTKAPMQFHNCQNQFTVFTLQRIQDHRVLDLVLE